MQADVRTRGFLRALGFLFLAMAQYFGGTAVHAAETPPRPNVIFILADDLGYTDLACYGSKYYETPNLDRMAAEGMRFTSGYTCGPNCQPTRAALMSGQYGPRTGVYTVGSIDRFDWHARPLRPVDNVTELPLDKVTLARTLKDAGYVTGMFGKWHLGDGGEHHPSKRGFDEAIVSAGKHFKFNTRPPVEYPQDAYLADFLTDKASDFIRRHKSQPFFLYLPHFGVHSPLQAKKELIERFQSKTPVGGHNNPVYAAMLASVDESVGKILALLDELKLAEQTLVIFSSDNGGVGGYRDAGIDAGDNTNNAPLRAGKGTLYEGGVRVPYIFRRPGTIAAGAISNEPINSVDLYPTILELTGAQRPAEHALDGNSYVSLLKNGGKAEASREPLFWHFPGYLGAGNDDWRTMPVGSIRMGDFKLLEFFEDSRLELYNLQHDIGEKQNLATTNPAKAKELHDRLVAWRAAVKAPMPTANDPKAAGPAKKKKKKSNDSDE